MNSVSSPAPLGVTPIDGIMVPFSGLDLASHDAGVTAAVDEAAAFFRDRVEGFLAAGNRVQEAGR